MLTTITDATILFVACWSITAITVVGVMVLPWTREQLLRTHDGVHAMVEWLVPGRLPAPARVAPAGASAELPELAWDLAGDWTTATLSR